MKNELYDLASRVKELAVSDQMNEKRKLWREHHCFRGDRPLIYLRAFAYGEYFDASVLKCTDPFLRGFEMNLQESLYRATLGDDYIIEPWMRMNAAYRLHNGQVWGVPIGMGERPKPGGAAPFHPVLLEEDFSCLKPHDYEVNEEATALAQEKLQEALGDAMPVFVSRESVFGMWTSDISTDICKLRGMEQLMLDMYDNADWLHSLLAFMRDTIMKVLDQTEAAGGFSLADHQNQCMPYSADMEDPNPSVTGVSRNRLWRFMAAQEYTGVGPDMFWEFCLQYQLPILEKFGMSAYGCCEDLSQKIPYLRRIRNLRRIAVTPFADPRRCAEEIGQDYILSWRPNPSSMVSRGLDEDFVRKFMQEHFSIFKENHSHFDITLKDVETVNHQPDNVRRWTQIVREEIEKAF